MSKLFILQVSLFWLGLCSSASSDEVIQRKGLIIEGIEAPVQVYFTDSGRELEGTLLSEQGGRFILWVLCGGFGGLGNAFAHVVGIEPIFGVREGFLVSSLLGAATQAVLPLVQRRMRLVLERGAASDLGLDVNFHNQRAHRSLLKLIRGRRLVSGDLNVPKLLELRLAGDYKKHWFGDPTFEVEAASALLELGYGERTAVALEELPLDCSWSLRELARMFF